MISFNNSVAAWDSVGHMSMMAALETEFEHHEETDDIIDFSSYPKGMEILSKYEIQCLARVALGCQTSKGKA